MAHPASIDSIPTSAGMEDFVSMGVTSANKLLRIIEQTQQVVAIELLLCRANARVPQAIETRSGCSASL